ncbi:MAG: hypothetical protein WKG07_27790 [Hymenobacter sp.]
MPVTDDARLPQVTAQPPLMREHRLYQTDWLMRFYGFAADEILDPAHPHLDLEIDPKLAWALRNRHVFPVDVNTADCEMMLRVPGVGARSAKRIVAGPALRLAHDRNTCTSLGVVHEAGQAFPHRRASQRAALGELNEQQVRRQILFGGTARRARLWSPSSSIYLPKPAN